MALVVRDSSIAAPVSESDIKAHLKVFAEGGVISKFGIPDKIIFVDSLPRTSVGKINKKELRETYGEA
jgi:fatty-acyl-CoA synthase